MVHPHFLSSDSFYGSPSTYLWDDDDGVIHEIAQGEGGEQGDALMPLLFSLGLHRALCAVSDRLLPTERLLPFLDDLYVICSPERVLHVHRVLQEELCVHSRIQVHHGKTQVWNRAGVPPNRFGHDDRSGTHRRSNSDCVEG